MPPEYTAPGVFIEEIPAAPVISGAATSVAAFIGSAAGGPLDAAQLVMGFPDYERMFGGLAAGCEMSYAVQQFFANGGRQAWIVRVAGDSLPVPAGEPLQTALAALDNAGFNLLCVPGVADPATVAQAIEYCRQRRAFLIIDAPRRAVTPSDMAAARAALHPPRPDSPPSTTPGLRFLTRSTATPRASAPPAAPSPVSMHGRTNNAACTGRPPGPMPSSLVPPASPTR